MAAGVRLGSCIPNAGCLVLAPASTRGIARMLYSLHFIRVRVILVNMPSVPRIHAASLSFKFKFAAALRPGGAAARVRATEISISNYGWSRDQLEP